MSPPELSRRERQIMDVLYARRNATAADVQAALSGEPSNSTVRTLLRVLVEKGHIRHRQDGPRYVYEPVVPRSRARRSALRRVVSTFFDDSPESLVETLLDMKSRSLTDEQLDRLSELIERARKEGR